MKKRYIKFRYWSASEARYVSTDNMPTCGENEELFELEGWDNDVFEQFTGLTDRNGKDVYEGDIVEKNKTYGKVEYCSLNAAFYIKFRTFKFYFGWDISQKKIQVVGNIHQNIDLLS